MSIDNEINLYVNLIREVTPMGSSILLKPHPRCCIHILEAVQKAIGSEYNITVIENPRFSRIPIELWSDLVIRCTIATFASVSGVYLNYFYGAKVIYLLNADTIARYFYPEWIRYVTKINTVLLESMDRLNEWDCKSPLWKASESML